MSYRNCESDNDLFTKPTSTRKTPKTECGSLSNCIFKTYIKNDDSNTNCPKKNRNGSNLPSDYNGALSKLNWDGSTGEDSYATGHKTIILEALVRLRVSTQYNICHLSKASIPRRHKKCLKTKFTRTSKSVDKLMGKVTLCTRNVTYTNVFAHLYQLESQHSEDLHKYIDILTSETEKETLCGYILNFICYFYDNQ